MNNNIVQVISDLEDMRFIKPAAPDEIKAAENNLGLKFADDYTEYVAKYGVISARGIELTGVTSFERLSVVSVTQKEREFNANIPSNMYVVENVAIDGIVALQDENGYIYAVSPNQKPKKLFDSLVDYIENAKF